MKSLATSLFYGCLSKPKRYKDILLTSKLSILRMASAFVAIRTSSLRRMTGLSSRSDRSVQLVFQEEIVWNALIHARGG